MASLNRTGVCACACASLQKNTQILCEQWLCLQASVGEHEARAETRHSSQVGQRGGEAVRVGVARLSPQDEVHQGGAHVPPHPGLSGASLGIPGESYNSCFWHRTGLDKKPYFWPHSLETSVDCESVVQFSICFSKECVCFSPADLPARLQHSNSVLAAVLRWRH